MIFNKIFLILLGAAAVLGSPVSRQRDEEEDAPESAANMPPPQKKILFPSSIYRYDVGTGAISCSSTGVVKKHWSNQGHDITTLVTFRYPELLNGKTCQFQFSLSSGDVCEGSKKIDVFTSVAPVAKCPTSGWPPGNRRDLNIGRMNVAKGQSGTWEGKYNRFLTDPTPCPHGVDLGMELAGVYDVDDVEWPDPRNGGPRIYYW